MIDDQFGVTDYGGRANKNQLDAEITKDYARWIKKFPSIKIKRAESFSEWLRSWIADPDGTEATTPHFTRHFKETVDAKTFKALKQFSNEIRIQEGASALQAGFAAFTRPAAIAHGIRRLWERPPDIAGYRLPIWTKWAGNRWKPLFYAMDDMYKDQAAFGMGDVKPSEDARIAARLFAGRDDMIMRMFEEGIFDPTTETRTVKDKSNWIVKRGIEEIFEKLDRSSAEKFHEEYHEAVTLGLARRIIELKGRPEFKNRDPVHVTGTTKGDLQWANEAIAELNAKHTPEKIADYHTVADGIREWGNGLLEYAQKRGRLSRESVDDILKNNDAWVPLQRIMDMSGESTGNWNAQRTKASDLGSETSIVQRLKGSRRGIKDMFQSLIESTNRIITEADRNHVAVQMVDAATINRTIHDKAAGGVRKLPVAGDIIRRLPKDASPNPLEITVWRDGKKERWAFRDKDIFKAYKGLETMGIKLGKFGSFFVQGPAKLLRHSIVYSPPFMVRNYIRDSVRRGIISERPGTILPSLPGVGLTKSAIVDFELFGGGQGKQYLYTQQNWEGEARRRMKQIAADKNVAVMTMSGIRKLAGWYHKGAMLSEVAGRIPEYREQLRYAKETLGYNEMDASLYATFKARDLLDFAISGDISQILTMLNPFTNAGIQGLKRDMVALRDRKGPINKTGFMIKWASTVLIPEVAAWQLAKSLDREDEYLQLPLWRKLLFWNYPMPDGSGKKWITVPKPFELGAMGTGVWQMIMAASGRDPDAMKGVPTAVLSSMLPIDINSFMPMLTRIAGSIESDYDSFYDSDIVGFEKHLPPEERKIEKERGSSIAKILQAPLMGASRGLHSLNVFMKTTERDRPFYIDQREIDYVIRGIFGTSGSLAIDASNKLAGRDKGRLTIGSVAGIAKEAAGTQARDVRWVRKHLGRTNRKALKTLNEYIKQYYTTKSRAERDRLSKVIVAEGKRLRAIYDPTKRR
jgi:hypothetical protein